MVAVLALSAAACGGRQSSLATQTGPVKATGDASPLVATGDTAWQSRGDRAQAEAAIKSWEAAANVDPTRADIQMKLAYGYYFLANVHVRWEEDPEDAQRALYEKGIKASENGIRLSTPAFAALIKAGKTWKEAVPTVGKDGVPGLYWYATNLGKWALLDGFTTILSHKDDIELIMTRCKDLDPGYWHGAPHRYFGVYRTKIPFPGGDLPAAKKHFEEAIKLAPNYLDTKVLFADAYAPKKDDEALFKKLLNEVIATPDDAIPALIPETKNAKRLAKQMLENIEDFF